jgi:hypothetical protein
MTLIDRRAMLKEILPGAVVTAVGVAALGSVVRPTVAEAFPSIVSKLDGQMPVEQIQWRRRRRWVCWWRRGRRICGWRWV